MPCTMKGPHAALSMWEPTREPYPATSPKTAALVLQHGKDMTEHGRTKSPDDDIDNDALSKPQQLPQVQQSQDQEDDEGYYSTNERWDVTEHLPIELGATRRVRHRSVALNCNV
jgi:hypothetical protein